MNQIPIDGIADQVKRAQECLEKNDLNGFLYNIAPAIDASSKNYGNPKRGNRLRIENYLGIYEKDLVEFSTQGKMSITESGNLYFGRNNSGEGITLASIIYKYIRCGQSHDSIIDRDKIYLGGDYGVSSIMIEKDTPAGYKAGQHIISSALCLGLLLIVRLDNVNKKRSFPVLNLTVNDKQITVASTYSFKQFTKIFVKLHDA